MGEEGEGGGEGGGGKQYLVSKTLTDDNITMVTFYAGVITGKNGNKFVKFRNMMKNEITLRA